MEECESLKKCREAVSERLSNIEATQAELGENQKTMLKKLEDLEEMLTIYRNGKGFFSTAGLISKVLVWLSLTGGAIIAIWKAITHIGQP